MEADSNSRWPKGTVKVYRQTLEYELADRDEKSFTLEEVCQYQRNYAMLSTFEPFRQLRDGQWKYYALISREYVRLDVLDLQTGEVIATEQPSEKTLKAARDYLEKYPRTDTTPEQWATTWGFCPTEFFVPDWLDDHDPDMGPSDSYWDESDERVTGEFGVYSGCVWGDDSSWKLQYVDLSRISEGVVATDDRFGYIELPAAVKIRDAVRYVPETDRFAIAMEVYADRSDGGVLDYSRRGVNWKQTRKPAEEPSS